MERTHLPKDLTAREMQVLQLVAEGWSNSRIAARLKLSTGTVNIHVHHILRKLNVRNRVQAAGWFVQRHAHISER